MPNGCSSARTGGQKRDALQRLQRISDRLATRAADFKSLSDAAKPLYDSLDDAQKSRFGRLLMAIGRWCDRGGRLGRLGRQRPWRHAEADAPQRGRTRQ